MRKKKTKRESEKCYIPCHEEEGGGKKSKISISQNSLSKYILISLTRLRTMKVSKPRFYACMN